MLSWQYMEIYLHVFQLTFEHIQLKVICDDVSNLIHHDMDIVTFPFVYLELCLPMVRYLASTACHTQNSVLVPRGYWKKKNCQIVFERGLCVHRTSILSMFLYDSLLSVYPQWPGVYFSRYQLWMGLFALVFLDNSSTVSLSDVHLFRKRVVLIVGCVASLCVGFSLVLVSMGHNEWFAGFSLQCVLLLRGTGSRASVAAACELGIVASRI